MRTFQGPAIILGLCLTAAVVSTVHADSSPDITASSYAVHVGETVTLSSPICPTGNTVTGVWMQSVGWPYPKGLPPELPLDLNAIALDQTGSGTSFTITTTDATTSLFFRIECNGTDSSYSPNGSQVRVFPPIGDFWWRYSVYTTQWIGTSGENMPFGIASLECDPTLPARATLTTRTSATPILDLTTSWYSDVAMFDMPIPIDLAPDVYVGTVECTALAGGTIRNSDFIYIRLSDGSLPSIGARNMLAVVATLLLAGGLALRFLSRRGGGLPSRPSTP